MEQAKQIFDNQKVLIMGLGTKGGGVASAKFAYKYGASITITDLQTENYLKESLLELETIPKTLVLGQHRMDDFENHDIIIKNPGIKYSNKHLQHAIKHNKRIETPISLFTKLYKKPFIGITGTKGKSYTTALVSHLLSSINMENIAAGNNCISPLDYLEKDSEFVLELSSWQLHEIGLQNTSPNIACWLNFFPDHLNYYSSINEYFIDKSNIFKYQSIKDYCIVPYEYTKIRNLKKRGSQIIYSRVSLSKIRLKYNESACYVENSKIIYKDNLKYFEIAALDQIMHNFAQHQLELVLASVCITIAFLMKTNSSISKEIVIDIRKGLVTFTGLEHRFEEIYKNKNLRIINDSAASTPESTILAIESVEGEIILIVGGGSHKNLDYNNLVDEIILKSISVILFSNDQTSEILINYFELKRYTNYSIVTNLKMACDTAQQIVYNQKSSTHITILFSPACSGYPLYKDMFERGQIFKDIVRTMISK